jgi:hypothetical protein
VGYSARYHVASLAAVFVALAVGILVGVGLGKNVVSDTTKHLEQSLKGNLEDSRARAGDLETQLGRERDFSEEAYPALVGGLLRGDRIAVIALGGLPDDMKGDLQAVTAPSSPTGAKLGEYAVVREPPDLAGLTGEVGRRLRGIASGGDDLSKLAANAGRSLLVGGPLLRRTRDTLFARFSGRARAIDGVILIRTRPENLDPADADATDRLEAGLLQGIESVRRVPVVGVERSDAQPSQISFFQSRGVPSTVDSIDLVSGQVALVYALRGAEGSFGIKDSADRLLPALRPTGRARGGT